MAGGSPVSEKYMEICFSSNVPGWLPTLESYMEARLNSQILAFCLSFSSVPRF